MTPLNNFYVDDYLHSSHSELSATQNVQNVKIALANCKFNLTSFASNSELVCDAVSNESKVKNENAKLAESKVNLTCAENEVEYNQSRALVVLWNTTTDELIIKLKQEPPVDPITKRTVLKYVASIFDPIGFVSPVILQGRKIFQEYCRIKLD